MVDSAFLRAAQKRRRRTKDAGRRRELLRQPRRSGGAGQGRSRWSSWELNCSGEALPAKGWKDLGAGQREGVTGQDLLREAKVRQLLAEAA